MNLFIIDFILLLISEFMFTLKKSIFLLEAPLSKKGLDIKPTCPRCLNDIEPTDHLYKDCHMIEKKIRKIIEKCWWAPTDVSFVGR